MAKASLNEQFSNTHNWDLPKISLYMDKICVFFHIFNVLIPCVPSTYILAMEFRLFSQTSHPKHWFDTKIKFLNRGQSISKWTIFQHPQLGFTKDFPIYGQNLCFFHIISLYPVYRLHIFWGWNFDSFRNPLTQITDVTQKLNS